MTTSPAPEPSLDAAPGGAASDPGRRPPRPPRRHGQRLPADPARPTGERRRSRERALGLAYEAESKSVGIDALLAELPLEPEPYALRLARGMDARRDDIDALISRHASGWTIDRMPAIDRALLRMATYELLAEPDVPVAVVIDEAVELAKDYSTEDSGRYVNGVLASLAAEARPS
ncbi:MAG: transcription antitermination factor NusB [Acidimicrobiales bacterium]